MSSKKPLPKTPSLENHSDLTATDIKNTIKTKSKNLPPGIELEVKNGFVYQKRTKSTTCYRVNSDLENKKKIQELTKEIQEWNNYHKELTKEKDFYLNKLDTIKMLCETDDQTNYNSPIVNNIRNVINCEKEQDEPPVDLNT